ncbi:HIT family protein [Haladaptatus sp. ZSTT2]|uniref:HIT family protein n=1 Tax=Haladaptatus sp. ZSTT2 TaxID=3120515 RepID=UPI00300E87C6
MADDCIFCKIIAGEIPSRTVYEDDNVLAFLDVNPLTKGHTLVIPKAHHRTVADLPDALGEAVFEALYHLTPAVEEAVSADGSNIGVNNGTAAGQEVQHVHAHIVPRFEGDGGGAVHSIIRTMPELTDEEFDAIADGIRAASE